MTTPAGLPPAPEAMTAASLPPARAGMLGTRCVPGIEYAVLAGFRPLLLDLTLPPEPGSGHGGRVPLIVFLHAGGWQQGSRRVAGPGFASWSPTLFEKLAVAGFAVASADYRLTGEARWPAQLDDVTAALRWLHRQGPELGLDTARVALMGESAGGHLAALAGLLAGDPERGGGPVSAVVDWRGPADMRRIAAQLGPDAPINPEAPDSWESGLLGAPPAAVPDLAADASPITHVHPAAPPFLIVHGTADRFVPCQQSTDLAAALRSCGVPVQLELIEGADHIWHSLHRDVLEHVLGMSLRFLREILISPREDQRLRLGR
jgi:acetyl esterase/lipase